MLKIIKNDWGALQVIRLLTAAGMNVPDDISVLGVDNAQSFVNLYPDITTLQYPFESVARRVTGYIAHHILSPLDNVFVVERSTVRNLADGCALRAQLPH